MTTFKFAVTAIVRPYLTIEAETLDEAKELLENNEFNQTQFAETGWPPSNIEIDEIYDEDGRRIEEDIVFDEDEDDEAASDDDDTTMGETE